MTITMISAPAFNYEPVVRNTGLLSKMFLVQVDSGRLYYRFVNVPTSCLRLRLRLRRRASRESLPRLRRAVA